MNSGSFWPIHSEINVRFDWPLSFKQCSRKLDLYAVSVREIELERHENGEPAAGRLRQPATDQAVAGIVIFEDFDEC